MENYQFIGLLLTIFGFIWSVRSESKQLREVIDANEKNLRGVIDANALETRNLIQAIQTEMKDFHGRLCKLESRRRR